MGVATGYTRTSLDGGYGSDADSDNYHLGVYGGKEYGSLALRAGAGYTLHRFDTSRAVRYGSQSDRASAQYSARTEQFFAEAGYRIPAGPVSPEPFANLLRQLPEQPHRGAGRRSGAAWRQAAYRRHALHPGPAQ